MREGNLTAMDASRLDFFLHAGKEQLCRDLRLTPAKTTEVLSSVFHEYVALVGNTEEGSSVQQHAAFLSQLSTVNNSRVNQEVLVRWCSRVFTDIVRAEQFMDTLGTQQQHSRPQLLHQQRRQSLPLLRSLGTAILARLLRV